MIRHDIGATARQIDKLIHELYALNLEEIAIVEAGSSRPLLTMERKTPENREGITTTEGWQDFSLTNIRKVQ